METWNYTLIWSSSDTAQVTQHKEVLLVLHGVDTFADVIINGQHVKSLNNFHR